MNRLGSFKSDTRGSYGLSADIKPIYIVIASVLFITILVVFFRISSNNEKIQRELDTLVQQCKVEAETIIKYLRLDFSNGRQGSITITTHDLNRATISFEKLEGRSLENVSYLFERPVLKRSYLNQEVIIARNLQGFNLNEVADAGRVILRLTVTRNSETLPEPASYSLSEEVQMLSMEDIAFVPHTGNQGTGTSRPFPGPGPGPGRDQGPGPGPMQPRPVEKFVFEPPQSPPELTQILQMSSTDLTIEIQTALRSLQRIETQLEQLNRIIEGLDLPTELLSAQIHLSRCSDEFVLNNFLDRKRVPQQLNELITQKIEILRFQSDVIRSRTAMEEFAHFQRNQNR